MHIKFWLSCLLCAQFVQADGWDDFSNNLATDLAPLLSLFGEQITKQFLSESIDWVDYLIFAMAPMGIITAIVSAVRVCGNPSLRAFVGRAQEGGGSIEAELCSSTSRDVCELYQNDSIARVFGRPKILEIVYDPLSSDVQSTRGIYTFQSYLSIENGKKEWNRTKKKASDEENDEGNLFAPNLSLNIGIKRQPPCVFWLVAIMGLILQVGVLIFAFIATYTLAWDKNGSRPESYACPLVIAGTLMLCSGVFLCAYLVGQSTEEHIFRRQRPSSHIYWLQPGEQILGDQIFDSFCYSDLKNPLYMYITSWKDRSTDWTKKSRSIVWAAVGTTLLGFALQFVGLRASHSAISVAQLGAIVVMSIARAGLRMQRSDIKQNFLHGRLDEVTGHELDWLAMQISQDRCQDGKGSQCIQIWTYLGLMKADNVCHSTSHNIDNANGMLLCRARLAELTRAPASDMRVAASPSHFDVGMVQARAGANHLKVAMEKTINLIFSRAPKMKQGWESATSLYCNFTCNAAYQKPPKMSSNCPWTQTLRTKQTWYLEFTRESPGSPWQLEDSLQLEGLLGLWAWSLKSDPAVEGLTMSQASGIRTRRIVANSSHISRRDLDMWFGSTIGFVKGEIPHTMVACCNASTIWHKSDLGTSESRYDIELKVGEKDTDQFVRFIGWPSVELSSTQCNGKLEFWSTSAGGSLSSLCVQELYNSFINCTMSLVEDFGIMKADPATQRLQPENNLVADLTSIFYDSQLGSREDALLSIMPTLLILTKKSFEHTLRTTEASQDSHRTFDHWKDAEPLLRKAWQVCITSPLYDRKSNAESNDYAELRELFRSSVVPGLGFDAIKWDLMARSCSQRHIIDKIVDCYIDVADILKSLESPVENVQGQAGAGIGHDLSATLLYLGQSAAMTRENKQKLLFLATKLGWGEVIGVLIKTETDPDSKDEKSRTALSHAAEIGNEKSAEVLLNRGASADPQDEQSRTPLQWAARQGHVAVAALLLRTGHVNIDAKDEHGDSPLFSAAKMGHVSLVQLLLDNGGDINAMGRFRRTPLWEASAWGHQETVRLLLDRGAKHINLKDQFKEPSLWWTAKREFGDVAKLLFDYGAAYPQGDRDHDPLGEAAERGNESMVKLFLTKGADIYLINSNGKTPIDRARAAGHEKVVQLLESDRPRSE